MNIIRGMDRISLVIAIISILPGCLLGVAITDSYKEINPEYGKWVYRYDGYRPPPPTRKNPHGLITAPTCFGVVLFGIRGGTRFIKWFSLWIIEGFKNEKK